jgi:hypothetical protein
LTQDPIPWRHAIQHYSRIKLAAFRDGWNAYQKLALLYFKDYYLQSHMKHMAYCYGFIGHYRTVNKWTVMTNKPFDKQSYRTITVSSKW